MAGEVQSTNGEDASRNPTARELGFGREVVRKSIHICSSVFALLYWCVGREWMIAIGAGLTALALILETPRFLFPTYADVIERLLGGILRASERWRPTGASYIALAILLVALLFPQRIGITVLLFMSVSDALASVIGKRWGRARFLGKSRLGSATFFVSACLIGLAVLGGPLWWVAVGAAAAAIAEATPVRFGGYQVDDNLLTPLAGGAAFVLSAALAGF